MSLLQKIFMTERRKGMFSSLLLLIIASWLAYDAFDSFFPFSEPIFQSSIALVLGVVLVDRIFTTPNSAISNSISCLIFSLMLLDEPDYPRGLWSGLAILCGLALITSVIGNLQYDNKSGRYEKSSEKVIYFCYRLSSFVGSAGFLWALGLLGTLVLLIESIDSYLLFWYPTFVLVTLSFPSFLDRMTRIIREKSTLPSGAVIASISPSCLEVAFSRAENMRVGDLVLIKEDCRFCDDEHCVDIYGEVVNLSSSGFDEFNVYTGEVLILGAWHEQTECTSWLVGPLGLFQVQNLLPAGTQVFPVPDFATMPESVQRLAEDNKNQQYLGHVIERATVNELRFQKIPHVNVERGDVVSVWIPGNGSNPDNEVGSYIHYQVRDIITDHEGESTPPYEMQWVACDQIGKLNSNGNFSTWDSTPYVRSPVLRVEIAPLEIAGNRIGVLPKTNIPVTFDINAAISYHTAILGTTGSGKTTLLKTIISSMSEQGKRLVVLDVHDDYTAENLGIAAITIIFEKPDAEHAFDACLEQLMAFEEERVSILTLTDWDETLNQVAALQSSGSLKTRRHIWSHAENMPKSKNIDKDVNKVLMYFLHHWYPAESLSKSIVPIGDEQRIPRTLLEIISDWFEGLSEGKESLLILKVHHLEMEDKQEIARIVADRLYQYCADIGHTEVDPNSGDPIARLGIVLEEAQIFVSQTGAQFTSGEDKIVRDKCRSAFTNIALGGRKYGIGLIVASQRSAFVSKGVLSQCNTLLALRTVNENDKTVLLDFVNKSFLPRVTYLGNPPNRPEAILMGSASSSKTPIIVQYDLPPEFQNGVGSNPARSNESREKTKGKVKPQG